jgi:predicted dehydrogenase
MSKTIGVLGLGSIGMRHAQNLKALDCNIRGYDPDMKRRLALNGVLWERDEVLKSDAIVIASPTSRHYFDITDVLAEAKPIFCEKPIADKLPNLENTFSSVAMVGYNLRFHPCVKEAKKAMGAIGEPLWANFCCAQYNDKPAYLRDGVILNWSHEIDLALYLLGPAVVTGSQTRTPGSHDDMTDILLTHRQGCMTAIHLDYVTKPELRGFTIYGTKGNMNVGLTSGSMFFALSGQQPVLMETDWNDIYKEEMEAFIRRVDGAVTLGATGQEGLDTLKICLEVRKQAGLI